jgi:CRP/FNR family transcriptional regulator, cyclic AMP receptor protein
MVAAAFGTAEFDFKQRGRIFQCLHQRVLWVLGQLPFGGFVHLRVSQATRRGRAPFEIGVCHRFPGDVCHVCYTPRRMTLSSADSATARFVVQLGTEVRLAEKMRKPRKKAAFSLQHYLSATGSGKVCKAYEPGQVVFSQGQAATEVYYIQRGVVKVVAVSGGGKEAVIAISSAGDFFGEGCLLGQSKRLTTVTAIAPTSLLVLEKKEAMRVLGGERAFADEFILHMLKRNARIEADLVDQLFNSTEKRLARALLLLAHYGTGGQPETIIPRISQQTLADIVGTNRGRINIFMNKFKKLGFIEYNGGIQIKSSLMSVVLHD